VVPVPGARSPTAFSTGDAAMVTRFGPSSKYSGRWIQLARCATLKTSVQGEEQMIKPLVVHQSMAMRSWQVRASWVEGLVRRLTPSAAA
jgi:hypothetical protein